MCEWTVSIVHYCLHLKVCCGINWNLNEFFVKFFTIAAEWKRCKTNKCCSFITFLVGISIQKPYGSSFISSKNFTNVIYLISTQISFFFFTTILYLRVSFLQITYYLFYNNKTVIIHDFRLLIFTVNSFLLCHILALL